ncbi:MAG: hypothetical protein FE78DRAFT_148484, partial [Acidomyces sp. 'richmondensis']
ERSLIDYINELSRRSATPTLAMVTAFTSQLTGRAPSYCWVSRFANRHRLRAGIYVSQQDVHQKI